MASPPVELRLTQVRTAVPAGPGVEAGLVVLQEVDPPGRMLRMVIGQPEARAIQAAWQAKVASRPSTWDLFASTITVLGGTLIQVVITVVEEERHFFATLELVVDDQQVTLPCRPSDAIALALRAPGAKMLARRDVLDSAGVLADGTKPPPSAEPAPEPPSAEPAPEPPSAEPAPEPPSAEPTPEPPTPEPIVPEPAPSGEPSDGSATGAPVPRARVQVAGARRVPLPPRPGDPQT